MQAFMAAYVSQEVYVSSMVVGSHVFFILSYIVKN